MGALCSGGSKRGQRRVGIEDSSMEEMRPSREIIEELKEAGIIQAVTKSGGLTFNILPDSQITAKKPRRLPAILTCDNRVHPSSSQVSGKTKEKTLKAEERRQKVMDGKGKMGREFRTRREAVLQRKEDLLKEKIKRTEAKLKRKTANKQVKD